MAEDQRKIQINCVLIYYILPVIYYKYNTGIILEYSNIYAGYNLAYMHECGYSMLCYGAV
jgi:hypothetical protein